MEITAPVPSSDTSTAAPTLPQYSHQCRLPQDTIEQKSEARARKRQLMKALRNSHDSLCHLIQSSNGKSILKSPSRHLSDLMYIEYYENGGGYALHAYAGELSRLDREEITLFAKKFFSTLFTERRKRGICVPFSNYCIGVVHGAARRFPELLSYLSRTYPSMMVNTNPLEQKNATEAISLAKYANNVFKSYSRGIFRFGPMHSISIVGVKGEERGYFSQDILNMIESDPFLHLVTPWGSLSSLRGMDPHKSDDGPIIWVRHGEQSVPVCSSIPRKRRLIQSAELTDLLMTRRTHRIRQVLVPDRTPCHADHADDGLGRHTTAAIGLLKAIYPPDPLHSSNETCRLTCFVAPGPLPDKNESWEHPYCSTSQTIGRIIKDVVVFDPRHYPELVKRLRLDIMEPPASQCGSFWADDGELNQLHSEGFSYVRLPLRDNDIYFIPRNVVHQFKTVSAGVSIAWHVRLQQYYEGRNSPSSGVHTTTLTGTTESNGDTSVTTSPRPAQLSSDHATEDFRDATSVKQSEPSSLPSSSEFALADSVEQMFSPISES